MDDSAPESPLSQPVLIGAWCTALFSSLRRAGVRHVVVSPGSRNTPLTLAALDEGGLTCHSVIDERSAAFFALGLAKGFKRPVALLCTSGTAGAHYSPAVIEASYDGVALVVITADRPPELQHCGAPQTIDQEALYGPFVRAQESTPLASSSTKAFAQLAEQVLRVVQTSSAPRPGPTHLNVPLRKPLEPEAPSDHQAKATVQQLLDAATEQALPASPEVILQESDLQLLVDGLRAAARPLLITGPLPPGAQRAIESLAADLGLPLLGEYAHAPGLSGLEFFPDLLDRPHDRHPRAPDVLVHFGPPCVSSSWGEYVASFPGRYFVVSGTEHKDPSRRAEAVVLGDLTELADRLRSEIKPRAPPEYGAVLLELQTRIQRAVAEALQASLPDDLSRRLSEPPRLSEPGAVVTLLEACPKEAQIVLANSLPLRLASWLWRTDKSPPPAHTMRGVNGIDGSIAHAAGVCAATDMPTLALVGDVASAHDIGSLALLAVLKAPFVLAILDNGGGRIFDHLPVRAKVSEDKFRFWTTPPAIDWGSAAQAFGLKYVAARSRDDLRHSVQSALQEQEAVVVRVPSDPATSIAFLKHVHRSLGR